MADQQVLPRPSLLTESFYKKLVAEAIRRVELRHDLTDKDLADLVAASPETIGNARNGENKLQGHTLFNLLAVDELALESLLQHFVRRSVPIEAKCDTDALVSTSAAVYSIARAKCPTSPGKGAITDHECLELEPDVDAALEALSSLKSRCEAIRAGRAA